MAALEVLLGDQPTSPEDADRIVAALLAAPERDPIDEHSIPMLLVALRGVRGAPWDVVDRMRQTLLRRNQAYPAALVRIAGLRRLAELRDRQRGAPLLATALEEAWQLPAAGSSGAIERMRVVTRLAALVPAFGMRERGLELLAQVKERALREADLYVRNELLMSTAMAASRLGESSTIWVIRARFAALSWPVMVGSTSAPNEKPISQIRRLRHASRCFVISASSSLAVCPGSCARQ